MGSNEDEEMVEANKSTEVGKGEEGSKNKIEEDVEEVKVVEVEEEREEGGPEKQMALVTPLVELSIDEEVAEKEKEVAEKEKEVPEKQLVELSIDDDVAEVIDLDDEDDLQIVHESAEVSGGRILRSAGSTEKCTTCRQRLGELRRFNPGDGVGLEEMTKDSKVNIDLGEEAEALQYKLTDFAVYDRVSLGERHLVPIFAESLLSAKKEFWVSGKVVRIDQEEEDEGLRVVDLGPITQWTNTTGIEGGENNVIISMEYKGTDVEFNLVRPHKEYMPLYKNIFRMVFMANKIIVKLIDCNDMGGSMEYSELLEFIESLEAPELFDVKLPRCDEEFLQLHADFIVSQVRSWEGAGEEEENCSIEGMPCINHISKMAGVDDKNRGRPTAPRLRDGMAGHTPQPEVHVQAVTTPLIGNIFESMMKAQMKENQGKSKGGKVCTCKACQRSNCGRCTKCNDMISFGGDKEDTSVTCLQRQCLNLKDVTLDGEDEENFEGVDWVDQVRWEGNSVKVEGGFCYDSAIFEVEGGKEHRVKPGDFLLVRPDREEDRSVRHYPARLVYLKKGGAGEEGTVHVQWLARGNDTVLGNTSDPREFFLTRECENVLISDVSKVLDLQRRAVKDFEAWRRQGGTEKAIAGPKAGGQDGWWRQMYIPEHGRFEYPQEKDLTLGEGDFCRCCNEMKEENEKAEVGWSKDGSWVRMGGTKFNKGDFIMIEDETLSYTVPKKEPQEFKKKKKDPAVYPEDWRKPDIYKGDHVETFDPFQVVRLEEVREKDGYVRVRKLYRPHDTHMSVREARGKPYTYLYWSEEIGRLYTPVKAAQKDKPSMEAVVSRAWVKAKSGGVAEDLQDWTDEGEDRFFISQSYNANTKTFSPLYKAAVDAVNRTLSECPAPSLPSIKPLQCLDVFAGCGGLSQGLHQVPKMLFLLEISFYSPSLYQPLSSLNLFLNLTHRLVPPNLDGLLSSGNLLQMHSRRTIQIARWELIIFS